MIKAGGSRESLEVEMGFILFIACSLVYIYFLLLMAQING